MKLLVLWTLSLVAFAFGLPVWPDFIGRAIPASHPEETESDDIWDIETALERFHKRADKSVSSNSTSSASKTTSKSSKTTTDSDSNTTEATSYASTITGGIKLNTPATTSTTYVKIGSNATWRWTYTSLDTTPSAINIEAYCSGNSHYYTIATSVPAHKTKLIWDTSSYTKKSNDTVNLINSKYTLIMYDAAHSISATASGGHMSAYSGYVFGVYSPQSYTPLACKFFILK